MTALTIPLSRRVIGRWCRDAAGNSGRLLLAALREIFDEASYARFLERTGQPPSRAAYAGFLRERAASHERRPRCC